MNLYRDYDNVALNYQPFLYAGYYKIRAQISLRYPYEESGWPQEFIIDWTLAAC